VTGGQPADGGAQVWRRCAWTVAAAWATFGVGMMLLLSPRVPYADPWRFLARLSADPFPANVLASDNGHREVLPGLLRLAELEWLHANQWLQIGAGCAIAILVGLMLLRRVQELSGDQRAAAALALATGLFWLGNGRKLAHGNESVPLFLILALLLAGLQRLARSTDLRGSAMVTVAALLATFTFGSGLACFPAFAVALWLRGAALRAYAPLAGGAVLALAGVWSSDTSATRFTGSIADRAELWARWIGAPAQWAFSPALDPAHAARQPFAWLRALVQPLADGAHAEFGPHLAARWPALAFGIAGSLWLVVLTVRCRRRAANAVERLALGLAWFGVAVGGLVVVLRVDYFAAHAEQISSQRYVPWSMLVWTGLVLATVARAGRPWPALLPATAFAVLLAPSQVWTTRYAWKQRDVAERTALAAAVGVLATDFPLEETVEADLRAALPILRERGAAMFAWPELACLGQAIDRIYVHAVPVDAVRVREVDNRLGEPGCEVTFTATIGGTSRLLLVDGAAIVRGVAIRRPLTDEWFGVVRGSIDGAAMRAAALR